MAVSSTHRPPTGEVILRFNDVSFEYGANRPILHEASFAIRRGSKTTLMGQNGAGKSTLFHLIMGEHMPESGSIALAPGSSIALARQVIPRDQLSRTIEDFFATAFTKKVYDLTPRIDAILKVVQLEAAHDRTVGSFSGGQQARLLLAHALIQEPDILLLDEPTNNLDTAGIAHLTQFLIDYPKTCLVISHDADFLNAFTHGVLYLDAHTRVVEQYTGNYFSVLKEIQARLERERMQNVRLEKDIAHRKDQANFFAQKGGHLRDVARKMREKIDDLSEDIVEVRREDKTIRAFSIPVQDGLSGVLLQLTSVRVIRGARAVTKKVHVELRKNEHLLLRGPNGIGKTTFLEALATGTATGEQVSPGVTIGYYRQDFSNMDGALTAYETLKAAAPQLIEQELRSHAAGFLLTTEVLKTQLSLLSEGQKGLVAFARLALQRPGLLILDEPTNHINFRHLPIIARALAAYEGAMILVSHVPDFVEQVRIDQTLDLGAL